MRIAQIHFAPSAGSEQNLLGEGIGAARITVTGSVVVDALLQRDPQFASNQGVPATGFRSSKACDGRESSRDLRLLLSLHPNPAFDGRYMPDSGNTLESAQSSR